MPEETMEMSSKFVEHAHKTSKLLAYKKVRKCIAELVSIHLFQLISFQLILHSLIFNFLFANQFLIDSNGFSTH